MINSTETIDVVMSCALVILTDNHLSTHTEKTGKWKAIVFLVSQILISVVNSVN
jgi:hypothetical protein